MEVAIKPARSARLLRFALRLMVTGAVFALLFSRIDVHAVAQSLLRIPLLGLLGSFCALFGVVATGVVRWRALLAAYGAHRSPSWAELGRWYFVGMFYNLLPGAVGGDLLRGYATRRYFADGAATRSVSVVFVERVLGLTGLLLLCALATLLGPLRDMEILLYASLGLCCAAGAVAALALGRRLSGHLPTRLAALARGLPVIEQPWTFGFAVAMSVVTHVLLSIAGHIVIGSLAPTVRLSDSLLFFPIGTLAAYFPLTVAGAGTRDTALVLLFARVGVPASEALASSLALLFSTLLLSAIGGLLRVPEQTE